MKVLYAVQGTGNGHIARAMEILPALRKRVQVDVLLSGMHSEIDLGCPVKFRLKGLGFKFGRKGGVDYFNTWWHGDIPQFLQEIRQLDLSDYDLVINDFEPVSAWAARQQHVPCVGLSNQCSLLHTRIPKPTGKKYRFSRSVLRHYAPIDAAYGLFYESVDSMIYTPVVRQGIRQMKRSDGGHYVVYLPSFKDSKIIEALLNFPEVCWKVYGKHTREAYRWGNIEVSPVNQTAFELDLASCRGVICAAGFATTSEVLFLGKKLLVIPMKRQFEQACNVLALAKYGVPSVKNLKPKSLATLARWLASSATVEVRYPENTQRIVDQILSDFALQEARPIQEIMQGKVGAINLVICLLLRHVSLFSCA